jgi:hypothetical protein
MAAARNARPGCWSKLFDIERDINGLSAEERLRVRKERSR